MTPRPPAGKPLTRRELEVATLAAQGLTSPQIAARLHISAHTVHSHLRAAYAKTGTPSRTALTGLMLDGTVTAAPAGHGPLTYQQTQVARLAAQGWPPLQIAELLGISPTTVYGHLRQARARTGSKTTAALAAWFRKHVTGTP